MELQQGIASVVALGFSVLVSGCGSGVGTVFSPTQTGLGQVQGRIMGGQQPVVGSAVYVYAAGTTGYGSASTSLLVAFPGGAFPTSKDGSGNYHVTTDANGSFSLTGEYTCTSGSQVYLYAVGGNAGQGVNSAAGFMAVLGECPASGTFATTIPNVIVNEATTVAAAYALSGFAVDATHIGSSGTTLALTGIANAFANAGQMTNIAAAQLGALAATPSGTGTVPQAEINSLANSLASCVNSQGPTSTACATLIADETSTGAAGGTPATDTATVAINIAHHPIFHVAAVYALGTATGPFQPSLAAAPTAFTVSLSFAGGGMAASLGNAPHNVAIDASGNVYTDNATANTLIKMSPLGVFASPTGFTGAELAGPTNLAVDAASANVYVVNSTTASVSRLTTAGVPAGRKLLFSGTMQDVAIDGSGVIWASDYGDSELFNYTLSTATLVTLSGNGLASPIGIAIEPGTAGNVWVADSTASEVSVFTHAGAVDTGSPFSGGGVTDAIGTAIDGTGNVWFSNKNGTVSAFTSAGAALSGSPFKPGATSSLEGIAIDGAGRVWTTDSADGTVYELNAQGANVSGTTGFAPLPAGQPDGLAIDSAGDVWYDLDSDSTLRELIGAAAPVVTPIAYGVANTMLGTKP